MAFVFRGEDRLLLQKAISVLQAIRARDAKAANPKRTTAISTRTLMLDANPPGTGPLYAASTTLLNRFIDIVNDTR